ncbi:hypothetical protein [Methyloversatilis sp. XJ19-49]|uniref:hypothetical protein n=1 Tax=Methyloversatilis sp. XJ19-49 TaxID=2963429 RepID=UPI00211CBC87|nr:hypothetical protein [Methyloversatilis sp. XJ19-49]MCQ9378842.1 hypothetical protein [Methyloversatilis sp. XJ19-49]
MIAFHAGSDSSDVAAWVQAIGSIVAIIGAIYAIHVQHRLEAKRARDAANDEWNIALKVIIELSEQTHKLVSDVLFVFDDVRMRELFLRTAFDRTTLQCNFEALETFDIHTITDARLRVQLLRTRRDVKLMLHIVDQLSEAARGRGLVYSEGTKSDLLSIQRRLSWALDVFNSAVRH